MFHQFVKQLKEDISAFKPFISAIESASDLVIQQHLQEINDQSTPKIASWKNFLQTNFGTQQVTSAIKDLLDKKGFGKSFKTNKDHEQSNSNETRTGSTADSNNINTAVKQPGDWNTLLLEMSSSSRYTQNLLSRKSAEEVNRRVSSYKTRQPLPPVPSKASDSKGTIPGRPPRPAAVANNNVVQSNAPASPPVRPNNSSNSGSKSQIPSRPPPPQPERKPEENPPSESLNQRQNFNFNKPLPKLPPKRSLTTASLLTISDVDTQPKTVSFESLRLQPERVELRQRGNTNLSLKRHQDIAVLSIKPNVPEKPKATPSNAESHVLSSDSSKNHVLSDYALPKEKIKPTTPIQFAKGSVISCPSSYLNY